MIRGKAQVAISLDNARLASDDFRVKYVLLFAFRLNIKPSLRQDTSKKQYFSPGWSMRCPCVRQWRLMSTD